MRLDKKVKWGSKIDASWIRIPILYRLYKILLGAKKMQVFEFWKGHMMSKNSWFWIYNFHEHNKTKFMNFQFYWNWGKTSSKSAVDIFVRTVLYQWDNIIYNFGLTRKRSALKSFPNRLMLEGMMCFASFLSSNMHSNAEKF